MRGRRADAYREYYAPAAATQRKTCVQHAPGRPTMQVVSMILELVFIESLHKAFNTDSYPRLAFPLFFGFVMDSGNHSFALSLSDSVRFSTLSTRGGRSKILERLSWSRCIVSARAAASAISSGLTSSPFRIRAAMSGVMRIRLTFVWKPGATKQRIIRYQG
jgi:hypothetical protein